MKRITTTLILLLGVYMLPWWLTFFAVCVSFLFFDSYVEGVMIALALDWLYSPNFYYLPNFHIAPIIALILCIFVPIIKKRLLI
jgi:hypothetical protein